MTIAGQGFQLLISSAMGFVGVPPLLIGADMFRDGMCGYVSAVGTFVYPVPVGEVELLEEFEPVGGLFRGGDFQQFQGQTTQCFSASSAQVLE